MTLESVLRSIPREWIVAIAVTLCATVGLQVVFAWIRRAWRRMKLRARFDRAFDGEKKAISLLEDHGFAILGAQVALEYPLRVDDELVAVSLRADYLVAKNGARFVAEVKTGDFAPKIETASTRRQLLEYGIAFDVQGVLLVDVEARRIREVRFPALERSAPHSSRAWIGVALAAAITVVAMLAQR